MRHRERKWNPEGWDRPGEMEAGSGNRVASEASRGERVNRSLRVIGSCLSLIFHSLSFAWS